MRKDLLFIHLFVFVVKFDSFILFFISLDSIETKFPLSLNTILCGFGFNS